MATFVTEHRNLQITVTPTEAIDHRNGRHEILKKGRILSFAPNGVLNLKDDDAEALDYLREHRWYGSKFNELGVEAEEITPTPQDVAKDVTRAAATLDSETLDRLLAEEQGTHNRPAVIELIESGQKVVSDINEDLKEKAALEAANDAKVEAQPTPPVEPPPAPVPADTGTPLVKPEPEQKKSLNPLAKKGK